MKFKVTVELEEGVKKTCEGMISTEALLLTKNNHLSYSEEELMIRVVADTSCIAITGILNYFKDGTMIAQRTKNGARECMAVQDIDEAQKWVSEGDKS